MKILALDTTSKLASVSLLIDGNIVGTKYNENQKTHSERVIPMMEELLNENNMTPRDIDLFGVTIGPGSFTGIRIGISAVKGMAAAKNKPCIGVSTLEAMAYMHKDFDGIICSLMDARCNQFYNGIFRINKGKIERLCEDRALLFEEICEDIAKNYSNETILAVGDGAKLFCQKASNANLLQNIKCGAENNILQQATGVVLLAENEYNKGKAISAEALLPFYLRLPQAERELKKRKEDNK